MHINFNSYQRGSIQHSTPFIGIFQSSIGAMTEWFLYTLLDFTYLCVTDCIIKQTLFKVSAYNSDISDIIQCTITLASQQVLSCK